MQITQKKQYALRAVFELAKNENDHPLKTAEIAEAQAIPVRFLEIILNHLKRTALEKMDLRVDCANQRLVANPAHPDQPISKIR